MQNVMALNKRDGRSTRLSGMFRFLVGFLPILKQSLWRRGYGKGCRDLPEHYSNIQRNAAFATHRTNQHITKCATSHI